MSSGIEIPDVIRGGANKYQAFVKMHRKIAVFQYKKNSIAMFKQCRWKAMSTQNKNVEVLPSDVALFGQLYISMQSRDSDLKEFYPWDTVFSTFIIRLRCRLHLCSIKSEFLKCISSST